MTIRFTSKFIAYLVIWALCVGLAAATRTVEPLLVSAPMLVALLAGLRPRPAPRVRVERDEGSMHVFEGAPVSAGFSLSASADLPLVEAVYVLPPDARLVAGTNTVLTCVPSGHTRSFAFTFRLPSRRLAGAGDLVLSIVDPTGFTRWEERVLSRQRRTVFPAPESVSGGLRPENTRVFAGAYPSRIVGEGLEFADIRPFEPGDKVSRVNWAALARTGTLYVNDFVTERNTDVVLLLDVFADAGVPGSTLLDLETRAAATLAEHYLREKNRVGLVEFGHHLRYLLPAAGLRAWYRMLATLADTRAAASYVTQEVSHIPPRVLPPQALVIALTGLVSERFVHALENLRARGFDVAVIRVSPAALFERESPIASPRPAAEGTAAPPADRRPGEPSPLSLARRLWTMREQSRAALLIDAGLPVVTWNVDEPIARALGDLDALRRRRGARR